MAESVNCHTMCQNEEQTMYLWRGAERLQYTFADSLHGSVSKMLTIGDDVYVATTSRHVYHGQVRVDTHNQPTLTFNKTLFNAIDIAVNSKYLFIINEDGSVSKINPVGLQVVETLILKEETKYCIHGFKQENEVCKVKAISVNDAGALYVTENGQLWASGDQPQIDIKSAEPRKVIFFEGRVVAEVVCGANFYAVVLRKLSRTTKEDTDSENDLEEEVFIKSCPQCLSATIPSSGSITSSDTCAGIHLHDSVSCVSSISKEDNRMTNGLEKSDREKEKKNALFINTEAAKQFLTRQLSWVSSYGAKDESTTDTADNPTKLIKQNVSNMANLVFEGVKTLSRHVSGSSDIAEVRDDVSDSLDEHMEDLKKSGSLRCEEFPWSSSACSSDHESSQKGLNERINVLVRAGNNLLSTEFWVWGDVKHGQLGTGDLINRPRPFLVSKLNLLGIRQIACGDYHILAMTLDGRVFSWGKNDQKQVNDEAENDQSSPQLFRTNTCSKERAKDVAAGVSCSLVIMHHGIFAMGKYSETGKVFKLEVPEPQCISKRVFCSGPYSCCIVSNQTVNDLLESLISEQIFLEEMIVVYQNLIKPFQKKGAVAQKNVYETLCRCYTELMSITALNVLSLLDHYNQSGEAYDIVIVASVNEYIAVYKSYLSRICGVISCNGFAHIAKTVEAPQVLLKMFRNSVKGHDTKKAVNEITISLALQYPLCRLPRFKSMIQNLLRCNGAKMGVERLQKALSKWEQISKEQEKRLREAETTKTFWDGPGRIIESLRTPERRLIRDSKSHTISLQNPGIFSSHSFVLLSDIFVHICGTSYTVHPLPTLWVELLSDSDTLQNALSVTAPEENLVLYTPTPTERNEWLQALKSSIENNLHRMNIPAIRTSSFTFTKHPIFKDAKYTGRWLNGKPHGSGKLEWTDGSLYDGHFYKGIISGFGKMEMLDHGVYEGQWKDGKQNGFGTMRYVNGDLYEGYFKDGSPDGHGMKKEGHFMASGATVYIGEWVAGVKQGYGIMDDIMKGEKYLGNWNNNAKHGRGLIVTLDGIYYEGDFIQDVLTGHGVMVFEDGTHYEGEFKAAGIFGGKGALTFRSGDILEGNMTGAWNEGVKVSATLHINKSENYESKPIPKSFGLLCVPPEQKWKAIFRQCYQQLGVAENPKSTEKLEQTEKLWQNVAVIISKAYEKNSNKKQEQDWRKDDSYGSNDQLNKILCFGRDELTHPVYEQIHSYLTKAFDCPSHPLRTLLDDLAKVYTASYGGVRVHPLLLNHAVAELQSMASRIYDIVTLFFPALPSNNEDVILEVEGQKKGLVVSMTTILYPIMLQRVYSVLFVLYALHNKKKDAAYWERLMKWNKQPDVTLMAFLGVEKKFHDNFSTDGSESEQSGPFFSEAIETLQQLKTTFAPLEKLLVLRNTFQRIKENVNNRLGPNYLLSMDELFPIFYFIVVRASVLQLGSEIQFIDDFMEPHLKNDEIDHMFTTLKACYHQILQEKMMTGE